jgi:cytochrome c peroxidase
MKRSIFSKGAVVKSRLVRVGVIAAFLAIVHVLPAAQVSDSAALFQPPLKSTWDQPRSEVDDARVQLGQILYHEKRLSRNNDLSCNSCHDVKEFGVDGVDFSVGFEGHKVGRNSPTTFNAFGHISQFWDGRATTVEEQAKGPILAAGEMAMPSAEEVVGRLKTIAGYSKLFKAAFPEEKDPIAYENVGIAIGAFERLLATPARWDDFLKGDADSLNVKEKNGLEVFVQKGCTTCHSGTLVGGRLYQKAGLVNPWPNKDDLGRYSLTQSEADKFVFKVPSLRNIEKTAPYFHDASAETLEEAVEMMAWHQVGQKLEEQETEAIVAFLKAMTADIPDALKATPKMPDAVQTSAAGFE